MDDKVLESLIENINIYNDEDVIDYTLGIIKENIFIINYKFLLNLLIKYIDNETFVINFIDRLISEMNLNRLINDIILKELSTQQIKNLLLLENLSDKIYFDIFFIKNIDFESMYDIFEYIYSIGKLNNYIDSIKKYIKTTNFINIIINNLFNNFKCYIKFLGINSDETTYITIVKYINYYITNVLYLYIDTKNILNYIFTNEDDDFIIQFKDIEIIKLFIKFFTIENDNTNIYFNKSITLNQILYLKYINNLYKDDFKFIDILKPIIDNTINLIHFKYNDILNKHERYNIYYDMAIFLTNIKNDYVPDNMSSALLDFLNIDFLSWIKIDEFIEICTLTLKLLIKMEKTNKLFNLSRYDDFLYKLICIENEIINNFEIQINKEIVYTNYSSIKMIVFEYMNILNLITHIQTKFISKLNETSPFKMYGDLIYMLNLQLNKYIILTENNNITKFSLNILIRNIIVSKLINFNEQININKYVNYNIEFDRIIKYYNNIKISIPNFIENIENLKKDSDNFESDLIDDLFCVKIKNAYRLPSQRDIFERDLLRLLIREKQEDPFTRKQITLEELDLYNENNKYNYYNENNKYNEYNENNFQ